MRILRRFHRQSSLCLLLALIAGLTGTGCVHLSPPVERTNGIPYGMRGERTLYLDVIRPEHPNGLGVLVLVSSGWKSRQPGKFPTWPMAPVLRRGYTAFVIYHVSQPQATVMEIAEDMHRAARFVRHNAHAYGVDPQHLGVAGGSAGGHLSLLLATRGAPGPVDAADPVDRESSAVQAVAIFYPVTDFLNLGKSTENVGRGRPPKTFAKAFGPQATNLAVWKVVGRETSPIYYITTNLPPTLIYHGDADTLVPLEQSERFQSAARALGCTIEVRVHRGGKHGWLTMPRDVRRFGDWFDQYLRGEGQ